MPAERDSAATVDPSLPFNPIQKAEFERVFEATRIPQAIHVNFVVEWVNGALLDLLGYSPSEMIGKPITYFINQDSNDAIFFGDGSPGQASQQGTVLGQGKG